MQFPPSVPFHFILILLVKQEELKLRHRADAISYLEALMPHNLMNGESYRREENLALFQSRYASSSSLNVKASSSKKFRQ